MSLSLEERWVGDVTVVTCQGRIVAGTESGLLSTRIDDLLVTSPSIVLHLGGIDFIDSSGLGLLVRCVMRAHNSNGRLSICAVSPKVREVLRLTRLQAVLLPYETETDAIADSYRAAPSGAGGSSGVTVLCVDPSRDVLAYLRELVKEEGYRVVSAENLPDGLILLTATQPKVVVIGAELHSTSGTRAADEFHRRASSRGLVVLPHDFSTRDAGEAAGRLLAQIRSVLPSPTQSTAGD